MDLDWKALFGLEIPEDRVPEDVGIALHLGVICLEDSRESGFKVIRPNLDKRYDDLIHDMGEDLVNIYTLESYQDIKEHFKDREEGIETFPFFKAMERILEAYEGTTNGFLTYTDIIKAARNRLVPHVMIESNQLMQKDNIPRNVIPPKMEYHLADWIEFELYQERSVTKGNLRRVK